MTVRTRDPGPGPAPAALVTRDVARAVAVLRAGGLVGLPTETVYGLAADATDAAAVARVFAVKGRPADHPLIVHVAHAADLDRWADDVPGYARRLAERLWPGPLTLVVPRSGLVGDFVTGGQPTVGLRCPAHPVAHEVLAAFGGGVAAPSANRFGRVSPTTAAHVVAELGERLDPARDVVLDGGPSTVGVESTILDCTGTAPRVLRRGAVTAAEVLDAGGVRLVDPAGAAGPDAGRARAEDGTGDDTGDDPAADTGDDTGDDAGGRGAADAVRAPGMLAAHYAPQALVVLAGPDDVLPALGGGPPGRVGLVAPAGVATPPGVVRLAAPDGEAAYARELYGALRAADERHLARVVAVPPAGAELAAAVLDRLRRAAVGSAQHASGAG